MGIATALVRSFAVDAMVGTPAVVLGTFINISTCEFVGQELVSRWTATDEGANSVPAFMTATSVVDSAFVAIKLTLYAVESRRADTKVVDAMASIVTDYSSTNSS